MTRDDDSPATPPADEPSQGEPASEKSDRKERVLHTRIPAVLEQELKRFAENLRVPVSNLVRTILEDALTAADRASGHVEEQLRTVVGRVSNEREHLREKIRKLDPLEDVLAFQPIVLAQETACAKCGCSLASGDDAWLGLTTNPGPRVIVCASCVPSRGASGAAADSKKTSK